jgi:hypothetical protein
MVRAVIGAVLGAIAMFIIGFIFFATPLYKLAASNLDDNQAAAVQQVMAANVPRTGTYFVPEPVTSAQSVMYGRGPIATVHYNIRGFAAADPAVLVEGFIHMLIVALFSALALYWLARRITAFDEQIKITGLAIAAAAIFMRLGEPIWYHHDWAWAIYNFIADSISLGVAALIILKMLPKVNGAANNREEAGATSELS